MTGCWLFWCLAWHSNIIATVRRSLIHSLLATNNYLLVLLCSVRPGWCAASCMFLGCIACLTSQEEAALQAIQKKTNMLVYRSLALASSTSTS